MLGPRVHVLVRGRLGRGGDASVGSSAILVALIVLLVGGFVGWHLRHASGAIADLKVAKNRIPGFRRTRNRSWLTVVVLVGLTLLMLRALLK
jgi:TRAP-type C4-dicarboxylate transport system permease small subunit